MCIHYLSIPAPPKVPDKPARIDPDKLSFKEKLALHKKTLEAQKTSASSPVRPPLQPSSAREGYRRPITPELGIERPSEQANTHTSSSDTKAKGGAQLPAYHLVFTHDVYNYMCVQKIHVHVHGEMRSSLCIVFHKREGKPAIDIHGHYYLPGGVTVGTVYSL